MSTTLSNTLYKIRQSCVNKINNIKLNNSLSSFVYFCFYKALREFVKIDKKSSKMRLYADRRFFHGKDDVFSVGPYNGTVCVSLTAKELRKTQEEQLKLFHLDTYRALTSPFRVFSDEAIL